MAGFDRLLKYAIHDAQEGSNTLVLCRDDRLRRRLLKQADELMVFAPVVSRVVIPRTAVWAQRDGGEPAFLYWMQTPANGAQLVFGLIDEMDTGDQYPQAVYWVWWPTEDGFYARVSVQTWAKRYEVQNSPWRQYQVCGDPMIDTRDPEQREPRPTPPARTAWEHLLNEDKDS